MGSCFGTISNGRRSLVFLPTLVPRPLLYCQNIIDLSLFHLKLKSCILILKLLQLKWLLCWGGGGRKLQSLKMRKGPKTLGHRHRKKRIPRIEHHLSQVCRVVRRLPPYWISGKRSDIYKWIIIVSFYFQQWSTDAALCMHPSSRPCHSRRGPHVLL